MDLPSGTERDQPGYEPWFVCLRAAATLGAALAEFDNALDILKKLKIFNPEVSA